MNTKINTLSYQELRKIVDPELLGFSSTAELRETTEFVGQTRALEALQFGSGIDKQGYNFFAMGPSGTGKRAMIQTVLQRQTEQQAAPCDWCYVHNFEDPQKPIALKLPAGLGKLLRCDMAELVEELSTAIPVMFESDDFRTRMQRINDDLANRQEGLLKIIVQDAKKDKLSLVSTPHGFALLPLNQKGEALSDEEADHLPDVEKDKIEKDIAAYTDRLTEFFKQIPKLIREKREREKELQSQFALRAVEHIVEDLKKKYTQLPDVVKYLDTIQNDVIVNFKYFLSKKDERSHRLLNELEKPSLSRYEVNILVDNSETSGVPIVFEEYPSYSNLICRVEHVAQFGALVTDFTLIRPGSLHRANGGYLIIEAAKVLSQPFAWEGLKRALYARKISIESAERMVGILNTLSLDPMPIPLHVKVILLGDRYIYHLLCAHDPDFNELFKVAVDFEDSIDRSPESIQHYGELLATLARKEGLKPLNRYAVAAIIERSSRIVEDREKLSVHMRSIVNLMREADYFAKLNHRAIIEARDVEQAIDSQMRRLDRIKTRFYEEIARGTIAIDTHNSHIGQINGLAVVGIGDILFGHPTKITANVTAGERGIIDIQREVRLGGPIHSKGVLILSGLLSGRYLPGAPISLTASLAFEQTYALVEGDSASTAEFCALVSALAELPIKQSIAVTGSVNQMGVIQAIGGVNDKIEGFFDICQAKGLDGTQGVAIPKTNIQHLMLRPDVVLAVKEGKFSVYPIETIDDAITLLTGVAAGERNQKGQFPKNSVNARVEQRLLQFSKKSSGTRRKTIPKRGH